MTPREPFTDPNLAQLGGNAKLHATVRKFLRTRDAPSPRAASFTLIAQRVARNIKTNGSCGLVFGCTHNSRRSIFSEVWANVARIALGVPQVRIGSAGSNPVGVAAQTAAALDREGFGVRLLEAGKYELRLTPRLTIWSKRFDDASLPRDFGLVVNCSNLDESCPVVPEASFRLSLLYVDPRVHDGTAREEQAYDDTSAAVARDQLRLFGEIRSLLASPTHSV